eukprot:9624775-Karenia_brevis.AAC.1
MPWIEADLVCRKFEQAISEDPDIALTCDDKDPHTLWICNTHLMMERWKCLINRVPMRWKVEDFDAGQILGFYRYLHDNMLPKSLLAKDTRFAFNNLPYVYPTVKRK